MVPAQQRFHADDGPGRKIHLRLEIQLELVRIEGAPQVDFQLQPAERPDRHGLSVERVPVSSLILRLVHGHVGLDEQILDVVSVLRVDGDADARRDHESMAVALERLAERLFDPPCHPRYVRVVGDVGQQDHELIAAQARDPAGIGGLGPGRRDRVRGPQAALQPARDASQQRVADRVTQVVVDALEAVEIEIQQRDHALRALRRGHGAGHVPHEQLPVGQAGQRVVIGEIFDLPFGAPPFGRIAHDDQKGAVRLRAQARLEGPLVAVAPGFEFERRHRLAPGGAVHGEPRRLRRVGRHDALDASSDQRVAGIRRRRR